MTTVTEALEQAVMTVLQTRAASEDRPTARQRATIDRAYARILTLIAPRIRHFTRQYGLVDHWEDAEQVCAIAVHRGIESYDPEKAKFTTFINWQLRGELQALRFRLRQDQRSSAKKVSATTISLDALEGPDGTPIDQLMIDGEAESLTEQLASDRLARKAAQAMIDDYAEHLRETGLRQLGESRTVGRVRRRDGGDDAALPKYVRTKPGTVDPADLEKLEARISRDRAIIEGYFLDGDAAPRTDSPVTRERERQIARRAIRSMAEQVRRNPRFAAAIEASTGPARIAIKPNAKSALPEPDAAAARAFLVEDVRNELIGFAAPQGAVIPRGLPASIARH